MVFVGLVEGDEKSMHSWARIILSLEGRPRDGPTSRNQKNDQPLPPSLSALLYAPFSRLAYLLTLRSPAQQFDEVELQRTIGFLCVHLSQESKAGSGVAGIHR